MQGVTRPYQQKEILPNTLMKIICVEIQYYMNLHDMHSQRNMWKHVKEIFIGRSYGMIFSVFIWAAKLTTGIVK